MRRDLVTDIARAAFGKVELPLSRARAQELAAEVAGLLRVAGSARRRLDFDHEPADFERVLDPAGEAGEGT